MPAHRLSWELANGRKVPRRLKILHKCDNRACINPLHLVPGTQLENMRDMIAKGRDKKVRGENQGNAKLTERAVREIRASQLKHRELAEIYSVNQSTISRIRAEKRWAHVEMSP